MKKSTKLLISLILFLILSGLGLISTDLPTSDNLPTVSPQPISQQNEATNSAPVKSEFAIAGIAGQLAEVSEVVDGDTIKVLIDNQEYTVRYIGINTPETRDPRRPVECFGKQASAKNKELLESKKVILQKDVTEIDKYNRLLRYIYLPLADGQVLFVNDYLVREGYAESSAYPPDIKYQERFDQAEKEARVNQRGLWRECL